MRHKGFTLIELLIAIAIMGALAAIALPQYSRYMARARQQDAKAQLMAIQQAQEAYKLQYGSYTSTVSALTGWKAFQGRYTFSITSAASATFAAQASGNIDSDATNDVWTIDQDGTLLNTTNDSDS